MKIIIFSDVHGNLTALEAALGHIEAQSPDVIIFAGDLCLFGPRPAECIAEVRRRDIAAVFGNTDQWIYAPPVVPEGATEDEKRRLKPMIDVCHWTQDRLSQADVNWLKGLPFEHRISPTGDSAQDLRIVHANPVDVHQVIFPTESIQLALFGEVQRNQSDEDLVPLLERVDAGALAFGHLHIPNVRQWRGLMLANISSVSLAGDGDKRAKYGILTWENRRGWSAQIQHVPYEMERELEVLEEQGLPNWQKYAGMLEKARM